MKLTKQHRADFVEAVMADVPEESYTTQVEDTVRKLWRVILKREGLENIDAGRLNKETVHVRYYTHGETEEAVAEIPKDDHKWDYSSRYICSLRLHGITEEDVKEIVICPEITELVKKAAVQHNYRATLKTRISAVIAACSTLKQAKEALPEFEKYLPAEPEKVDRSLPVVGNLVAELTKAGWPDKKKAGTKK